jgi:hypothetical protein
MISIRIRVLSKLLSIKWTLKFLCLTIYLTVFCVSTTMLVSAAGCQEGSRILQVGYDKYTEVVRRGIVVYS